MTADGASVPPPWRADGGIILGPDDQEVGQAGTPADADRIVACVNACARIPSFLLERGIVCRLIERHADALEEEVPGLRELRERLGKGRYH